MELLWATWNSFIHWKRGPHDPSPFRPIRLCKLQCLPSCNTMCHPGKTWSPNRSSQPLVRHIRIPASSTPYTPALQTSAILFQNLFVTRVRQEKWVRETWDPMVRLQLIKMIIHGIMRHPTPSNCYHMLWAAGWPKMQRLASSSTWHAPTANGPDSTVLQGDRPAVWGRPVGREVVTCFVWRKSFVWNMFCSETLKPNAAKCGKQEPQTSNTTTENRRMNDQLIRLAVFVLRSHHKLQTWLQSCAPQFHSCFLAKVVVKTNLEATAAPPRLAASMADLGTHAAMQPDTPSIRSNRFLPHKRAWQGILHLAQLIVHNATPCELTCVMTTWAASRRRNHDTHIDSIGFTCRHATIFPQFRFVDFVRIVPHVATELSLHGVWASTDCASKLVPMAIVVFLCVFFP